MYQKWFVSFWLQIKMHHLWYVSCIFLNCINTFENFSRYFTFIISCFVYQRYGHQFCFDPLLQTFLVSSFWAVYVVLYVAVIQCFHGLILRRFIALIFGRIYVFWIHECKNLDKGRMKSKYQPRLVIGENHHNCWKNVVHRTTCFSFQRPFPFGWLLQLNIVSYHCLETVVRIVLRLIPMVTTWNFVW